MIPLFTVLEKILSATNENNNSDLIESLYSEIIFKKVLQLFESISKLKQSPKIFEEYYEFVYFMIEEFGEEIN